MIISTKKGAPQAELDRIIDNFEHQGLSVTLIRGTDYNVFGLVGDTTKIAEKDVLANPWVENVTRVSAPYKRANRLFHPDDTVVDVNGIKIGGKSPIAVMAGPCSVEGEEHTLKMAKLVKAGGANFLRGGAYKPRTSPYSFQGLGTEGILDLVKARDLLKTFDVEVNPSYATSTAYRFFGSSNPAQGKFYNNRGTRLNYYAVTVLLARACLWAQKTDDALTAGDHRPGERQDLAVLHLGIDPERPQDVRRPALRILSGETDGNVRALRQQYQLAPADHRRQDFLHHADERQAFGFHQDLDQFPHEIHRQRLR